MTSPISKTVPFGELVAAAFDHAEQYSTDPRVVARIATRKVLSILRRAGETWLLPKLLPSFENGKF